MKKYIALSCFALLVSSCSLIRSNKNVNYLSVGESQTNSNSSQELVRLDYKSSSSGDKNKTEFEIEYYLYSYCKKTVELSHFFYVTFDGGNSDGQMVASSSPNSIAPETFEVIRITFECFKDWKTATVKYSPITEKSINYEINLRSSDFPKRLNNSYAAPLIGQGFYTIGGRSVVTFKGLEKNTIGSAYSGSNSNNFYIKYSIYNIGDEDISLLGLVGSGAYKITPNAEGVSCGFSPSNNIDATVIEPKATIDFQIIVYASKTWSQIVFSYSSTSYNFAFNLFHYDFASIID